MVRILEPEIFCRLAYCTYWNRYAATAILLTSANWICLLDRADPSIHLPAPPGCLSRLAWAGEFSHLQNSLLRIRKGCRQESSLLDEVNERVFYITKCEND
jgi:hypothetical protein